MKVLHVLATGLAVALAGTGIAVATADSGSSARVGADTTITACVDRKTGDVRIFRKGTCRDGEKAVSWAAGGAGSAGPRGARGPAGPSTGYVYRTNVVVTNSDGTEKDVLVVSALPAGAYVLNYTASAAPLGSGDTLSCRLFVNGVNEATGKSYVASDFVPFAMTGAFTLATAADAMVKCQSGSTAVDLYDQTLTLIRVGQLIVGQEPNCPRSASDRRPRC